MLERKTHCPYLWILEIPSTYVNYVELREDVLNRDKWEMDII